MTDHTQYKETGETNAMFTKETLVRKMKEAMIKCIEADDAYAGAIYLGQVYAYMKLVCTTCEDLQKDDRFSDMFQKADGKLYDMLSGKRWLD